MCNRAHFCWMTALPASSGSWRLYLHVDIMTLNVVCIICPLWGESTSKRNTPLSHGSAFCITGLLWGEEPVLWSLIFQIVVGLNKLFIAHYQTFLPMAVLALGYCHCLRLSVHVFVYVNPELICAITHHDESKLGSPNLDQKCKHLR